MMYDHDGSNSKLSRSTHRVLGRLRACVALGALLAVGSLQAAESGTIIKEQGRFGPEPIKIHITGYSPDARAVLNNDLIFMGFTNVPLNQAQFLIRGKNGGNRVEGRVIDQVNNRQVFGKAFTGSNARHQIHALADGIAESLTGRPGIAQTKITFRTDKAPGKTEVYIADFDGYNHRPVTRDASLTTAPCWAGPDMLFYTSYKLGTPKIYYHQLSTGKRQTITPYSGSNISPAVSPDGRKVAMILSRGGSPDLWVSDIDGKNLKRLTTTKAAESSPCWSPDSRSILFVSRARGPAGLFRIPATGGTMQRITTRGAPNATEPDWSPDGKWIAFTTQFRSGFVIFVVEAKGGNAVQMCAGEDPSWAANSRALIYCRGRDRNKRLSLLDVPTKRIKDIARISMSNSQPNWAKTRINRTQ